MRLSRFPGVETLPNCLSWRCGCFLGYEPHPSPVDPCTEWVRMPRTDTPVSCLPCSMGGAPEEGPQAHLAPSLSLGSLNPFLGSLEGLPWEPGDLMLPKSEGGRCQRRPSCFRTGFLDPHHPWGVLRTDTLPCGQPGLALYPGDWVKSLAPATGKDSRALWLCRCMSPNLPANPWLSQFLPGEGSWWELGASEFTIEQRLSNEEAGATQGPQGGLGAGASKVSPQTGAGLQL